MTQIGIIAFPGSNCEHDVARAIAGLGGSATIIWHGETALSSIDAVIVPGGFAHGDHLRPGAIARFSPVMAAVAAFADRGGPVLGICNGFQVLTEAGLLPGALRRNDSLRFICAPETLLVCQNTSVLSGGLELGSALELPINHYEGNYTCDESTLSELIEHDQVVLRYACNPNGSVDAIAGVANRAGNVVGLMPHPERASDPLLGSSDGNLLLGCFLLAAERSAALLGATTLGR